MRIHALKALLLMAGAALTVFLFFRFGFDAIVLPWLWSAEDTALIVGKTLLVRRVVRPLWRVAMRLFIVAFVGFRIEGVFRRKILGPVYARITYAYAQWMRFRGIYRALAGLGICVICVAIAWASFRVALIPLVWFVLVRLYYALGDLGLDQWTARLRLHYRFERFMHRDRIMRFILRRPRHELAVVEEKLERNREARTHSGSKEK